MVMINFSCGQQFFRQCGMQLQIHCQVFCGKACQPKAFRSRQLSWGTASAIKTPVFYLLKMTFGSHVTRPGNSIRISRSRA